MTVMVMQRVTLGMHQEVGQGAEGWGPPNVSARLPSLAKGLGLQSTHSQSAADLLNERQVLQRCQAQEPPKIPIDSTAYSVNTFNELQAKSASTLSF